VRDPIEHEICLDQKLRIGGNRSRADVTGAEETLTVALAANPVRRVNLTHLQRLEAKLIHILREVMTQGERPVMLYSAGRRLDIRAHAGWLGDFTEIDSPYDAAYQPEVDVDTTRRAPEAADLIVQTPVT
jgi:hypothetical protein